MTRSKMGTIKENVSISMENHQRLSLRQDQGLTSILFDHSRDEWIVCLHFALKHGKRKGWPEGRLVSVILGGHARLCAQKFGYMNDVHQPESFQVAIRISLHHNGRTKKIYTPGGKDGKKEGGGI